MNESQPIMQEAAPGHEAITTELLVEEGNYRIEIEGAEVRDTPELAPTDTSALAEAAETEALAELAGMNIVEFVLQPEIDLIPTPLELLPPAATATNAATSIRPHLRGEVAHAHSLEFEIQRSHG